MPNNQQKRLFSVKLAIRFLFFNHPALGCSSPKWLYFTSFLCPFPPSCVRGFFVSTLFWKEGVNGIWLFVSYFAFFWQLFWYDNWAEFISPKPMDFCLSAGFLRNSNCLFLVSDSSPQLIFFIMMFPKRWFFPPLQTAQVYNPKFHRVSREQAGCSSPVLLSWVFLISILRSPGTFLSSTLGLRFFSLCLTLYFLWIVLSSREFCMIVCIDAFIWHEEILRFIEVYPLQMHGPPPRDSGFSQDLPQHSLLSPQNWLCVFLPSSLVRGWHLPPIGGGNQGMWLAAKRFHKRAKN